MTPFRTGTAYGTALASHFLGTEKHRETPSVEASWVPSRSEQLLGASDWPCKVQGGLVGDVPVVKTGIETHELKAQGTVGPYCRDVHVLCLEP